MYNGVWSNTIPTIPPGYYLWTKTEIKFTNGETNVAYSVSKEGTGISSVVTYYQMANSKPSKNAIEDLINWKTTPNDFVTGQHYYTCVVTTYLDGHKTCSAVIEDKALTSVANAATSSHKILEQWTHDALLADTTIDGGYIKTHTIEAKNMAVNAIMSYGTRSGSGTYSGGYSRNANNVYSTRGSYLDLEYGNIYTPSFAVINTVPAGESIAAGAYFNGNIVAKTLQLGTNAKFEHGTIGDDTTGFSLSDNGTLACSNASVAGKIVANSGSIGGWHIGTDKLWYDQTSGSSTSVPSDHTMIFAPKGVQSSISIGGSGNNTSRQWLITAKNVFGITTSGELFSISGKIGGFTIGTDKLYNGTSAISGTGSETKGIYVGVNGIRNYEDSNKHVTITGGVITAKGADIKTGTIGGLTLNNGALYKDTTSIEDTHAGIYLGADGFRNYLNENANATIKNGVITARGANISGTITATSGFIGTKDENSNVDYRIVIGDRTASISGRQTLVPCIYWNITSPTDTDTNHTSGFYLGYDGIRLGSGFKADSSGNVFVNAAYIGTSSTVENRIYIGNTTVAGDATSPCIRYKITSFSDATHTSGFYLGSDGLRIGKVYVDSSGNTNLQTGTVIGSVTANHFTINSGTQTTDKSSMYYNKSSLDSNTSGIYLGTDGIALGAKTSGMTHSPFYVDSNGNLYATSATISGTLTAGNGSKIKAGSSIGNWIVDSNGYLKNGADTIRLSPTSFNVDSFREFEVATLARFNDLLIDAYNRIYAESIVSQSFYVKAYTREGPPPVGDYDPPSFNECFKQVIGVEPDITTDYARYKLQIGDPTNNNYFVFDNGKTYLQYNATSQYDLEALLGSYSNNGIKVKTIDANKWYEMAANGVNYILVFQGSSSNNRGICFITRNIGDIVWVTSQPSNITVSTQSGTVSNKTVNPLKFGWKQTGSDSTFCFLYYYRDIISTTNMT